MPALAGSREKDTYTNKVYKQKIKLFKFISNIAESDFTMASH